MGAPHISSLSTLGSCPGCVKRQPVGGRVSSSLSTCGADIGLSRGRTGQYVFISSASAYQTPPARVPILESTPLRNPFLQYSRDKIACEIVAWYGEDPARQRVDVVMDKLAETHRPH